MGIGLVPAFETQLPAAEPGWTLGGDALAKRLSDLESIAEQLQIRRLTDFFGLTGWLLEHCNERPIPPPPPDLPWFEPDAALATLESLHNCLSEHPELLPKRDRWEPEPAAVCRALKMCAGELEKAAAAGVRFRFEVFD